LARRIIKQFPVHETYTEPFAGGLNVLLNKLPAPIEIVSDLDANLVNFWTVVLDHGDELLHLIKDLPYTEEIFNHAKKIIRSHDWINDIDRAVNFLVRNRFSRNALGKDWAWSDRLRRGVREQISSWERTKEELPRVTERFQGVGIRRAPAIEIIREHDGPETTHYCDPTYLHSTRTAPDIYEFEMTDDDHVELLDVLMGCRGTVVLSGYPSELYDDRLKGWRRLVFDMPNHAGQGKKKQRRQEIIWINR
jgi:DNA adenine methylase